MQTQAQQQLTGVGLAFTGVLILSPDALLIRLVSVDLPTLIFWRQLLQSLVLWTVLLLIYRGGLRHQLRRLAGPGAIMVMLFSTSAILFPSALVTTSAANALLIIATSPLFAALISWLFLRERIALRTWVAIFVAIGGISIIFSGSLGGGDVLGDFLALACALTLGTLFTFARRHREINMVPALATAGLVTALIVSFIGDPLDVPRADWPWIALLGLVVLPGAFGLLTIAPRYIPSPEVSLIMQLEAILGPVFVWMGVGEVPEMATFIGGSIVFMTLVTHSALGMLAYHRRGRGGGPPPARPHAAVRAVD